MRASLRWLVRRLLLLLLSVFASSVPGQEVPTGPARPANSQACVDAFAAAFSRHFRDNACRRCDDMNGFPGRRWVAHYTACYEDCISARRTRIDALVNARSACFERARRHANEDEQEKLRKLDSMKAGEKLASAFDKAMGAFRLVNDPQRFFDAILGGLPIEARRRLGDAHRSDPMSVAAQVHAFTITWARRGIDSASQIRGRSDVIAAIQRDALERIVHMHRYAMDELVIAFDEADRVLATTYGAPAASFRATPVRSAGNDSRTMPAREDRECQLLSTRESADLANDDPDRFEELTRRCRGSRASSR